MHLFINGNEKTFDGPLSLAQLIEQLGMKGDRLAVFSTQGGGIGVVSEIKDGEVYYTMFSLNKIYHKKVSDVKWNEKNWRWETTGTGFMRTIGK